MQKRNLNKAALQLYQNHTYTQTRPQKFAAHPQNTLLRGEHLWGTASACQKNFKRLKL